MAYSKVKMKRNGDKSPLCFRPFWRGNVPADGLMQLKPSELMLPDASSRAPCNAAYQCQLHVTGGSAPSPPVSGGRPPSYDCMCAGLLLAAAFDPCHVRVTPVPPTLDSGLGASAQWLHAGNHPLTAAPVQSVSQHIRVNHASFLYEFSGQHCPHQTKSTWAI